MLANGGGPQVGPVSEVDRALERDAVHDDVGGVSLGGKIGETKARRAHTIPFRSATRFVRRRQYSGSTKRSLLTRRCIGGAVFGEGFLGQGAPRGADLNL